MLTKEEVYKLRDKPWLTREELGAVMETLILLSEANEVQLRMLRDALGELARVRARVDFYRGATFKDVG